MKKAIVLIIVYGFCGVVGQQISESFSSGWFSLLIADLILKAVNYEKENT